ncbi:MAG: transporter [Phycisphaeraceae bacterium]|nr:transporter [Phycisphaeraceae bacterium]
MRRLPLMIPAGLCLGVSPPAFGQYTLFSPVPRDQMRPMSTDRPDVTESPYTVDAGHFQLEMSFAEWTLRNADSSSPRVREWGVAPFLAKAGLLDNVDLQIGLEPYVWIHTDDPAGGTIAQGFGDTTVRLKVNLYGNDDTSEHAFAIAAMPAIKIPTAHPGIGNDQFAFAMIIPAGLGLGHGWDLGAMAEFDLVQAGGTGLYSVDFVHTATLGKEFTEAVGAFVEYAGVANFSHAEPYRASLNLGAWWQVTPDLKYDGGVRIGLTDAASAVEIFAGMTVRY